jgi:Tfp pilus assembly protein PilE
MYESRPLAGLASIVLVVAVLGAFAAFGFSNTDLANNLTRSAEARAKDQQTKQEAERAAVDLEFYRQQKQSEIEKLQIDQEKQRKQAEIDLAQMQDNYLLNAEQNWIRAQQQLEFERLTRLSGLSLLVLLALMIIFVLGQRFSKQENQKDTASTKKPAIVRKTISNPWHDNPAWKRQQIENARQREQNMRITSNLHKAWFYNTPSLDPSKVQNEEAKS